MHADPVASVSHEIKLVEVVYFALQAGGAATFGVEIKLKTCVFWPLQVFELPADLAVVYMLRPDRPPGGSRARCSTFVHSVSDAS